MGLYGDGTERERESQRQRNRSKEIKNQVSQVAREVLSGVAGGSGDRDGAGEGLAARGQPCPGLSLLQFVPSHLVVLEKDI